ncbi:hypothetical protein LX73_1722 [Fodinibius salinus]|uniref:Uncharacterized protein n=1 Tax=Fodinibius salinus TaxID=860790 RepID=A0A5D3YKC4_9BACT|nr:hypothetical protein [Fodinibius salinus]TYP94002.1 hypothetical protein LX73_1722 [Fodinibius salinus]
MRKVKALLSVVFILAFINISHAYETLSVISDPYEETLCVKYETETGWSQGYTVDVTVIEGSTLNEKTGTYDYNGYSTYAVIFWDNDQATIVELNYFTGSFSSTGTTGEDQRGREWKLAKTSLCY